MLIFMFLSSFSVHIRLPLARNAHFRDKGTTFFAHTQARNVNFLIKSHNLPLFSSPNPLSSPFVCHLLAPYLHWNLIGTSLEPHWNLIGISPNDERIFKQLSPKYHLYLQLCLLSSGVPENARGVIGCS